VPKTSDKQIHPGWWDSAIVKVASRRCVREGSVIDPLALLEAVHGIMIDLEERAPGIPFEKLLTAARPDSSLEARKAAAKLMKDAGVGDKEINSILGEHGWRQCAIPPSIARHHEILKAHAEGLTVKQIAVTLQVSESIVYRKLRAEKLPLNDGRKARWQVPVTL
jgi:hypothetical protein